MNEIDIRTFIDTPSTRAFDLRWSFQVYVEDCPNFRWTTKNIWACALPTSPEGYKRLVELGAKTRINLTTTGDDRNECEAVGLSYIPWPISQFIPAPWADLDPLVTMLDDESLWPVVIGCRKASDRTGIILARYRMKHGWTKTEALWEMALNLNPDLRIGELLPGIRERIEELT